jgi:hypothetical protein
VINPSWRASRSDENCVIDFYVSWPLPSTIQQAAECAVGGDSQASWFRCAQEIFFFFFFPDSIGGLAPSADHMANVTVIATCILIDIIFFLFSLT